MNQAVTAIIVTYNSQRFVAACIDSAVAAGIRNFVIWDNASGDDTTALVAQALRTHDLESTASMFVNERNVGFGSAVNQAMSRVATSYVLLLNPDCLLRAGVVDSLLKALADPAVGAVAPRMTYPDGSFGVSGGGVPGLAKEAIGFLRLDDFVPQRLKSRLLELAVRTGRPASVASYAKIKSNAPTVVEWVSGFCLAMRTSDFRAAQGFDPRYFMYFEDVDLCRRLGDLGLRCEIVRDAHALHFESQSSTPSGRSRLYYQSLAQYWHAHGARPERTLGRIMLGRH